MKARDWSRSLPSRTGVPWPTDEWPRAEAPPATPTRWLPCDDLVGDTDRYGTTYAVAVVQRGRLLAERYGGELEHWDRPNEPVEPTTRLLSWSMAKSILHAVVGHAGRRGPARPGRAGARSPAW